MHQKCLFLVRGLPGGGKSTAARAITDFVAEADHYFVSPDGVYRFEKHALGAAHSACLAKVTHWMSLGQPTVAVANTFTRRWELAPYRKAADRFEYLVIELVAGGDLSDEELAARNVHAVSVETIALMRKRWEP